MCLEEKINLLCKFVSYEMLLGLYGAKEFISVKDTKDQDKLNKIHNDLKTFYVVNHTDIIETIPPQNHLRLKNYIINMIANLYFTKWENYNKEQIQDIVLSRVIELYKELLIYDFTPLSIQSNMTIAESFKEICGIRNPEDSAISTIDSFIKICKDIMFDLELIDTKNKYDSKLNMMSNWGKIIRSTIISGFYEEKVIKYLNQRLEYYNVSEEDSEDLPVKEADELTKEEIKDFSVASLLSTYDNIINKYPDMKSEILEEFNKRVSQLNIDKVMTRLKNK